MTYTAEENQKLINMKENCASYKMIGIALGRKESALRSKWQKLKQVKDLPPKPIIKKTITTGRISLESKKIVKDNSTITVRDIEKVLREKYNDSKVPIHIPSKSTINRFLLKNQLVMVKLL